MEASSLSEPQVVSRFLKECWTRILQKEVQPTDDFFDLGGDSLTAIRMIMEVQSAYRVEVDVETFFEAPSIAKLTDIIVKASSAPGAGHP